MSHREVWVTYSLATRKNRFKMRSKLPYNRNSPVTRMKWFRSRRFANSSEYSSVQRGGYAGERSSIGMTMPGQRPEVQPHDRYVGRRKCWLGMCGVPRGCRTHCSTNSVGSRWVHSAPPPGAVPYGVRDISFLSFHSPVPPSCPSPYLSLFFGCVPPGDRAVTRRHQAHAPANRFLASAKSSSAPSSEANVSWCVTVLVSLQRGTGRGGIGDGAGVRVKRFEGRLGPDEGMRTPCERAIGRVGRRRPRS